MAFGWDIRGNGLLLSAMLTITFGFRFDRYIYNSQFTSAEKNSFVYDLMEYPAFNSSYRLNRFRSIYLNAHCAVDNNCCCCCVFRCLVFFHHYLISEFSSTSATPSVLIISTIEIWIHFVNIITSFCIKWLESGRPHSSCDIWPFSFVLSFWSWKTILPNS